MWKLNHKSLIQSSKILLVKLIIVTNKKKLIIGTH